MRSSFKNGVHTKFYKKIINKRVDRDVKKFELLRWQMIKK